MSSLVRRFWLGFTAPAKAFSLIKDSGELWKYTIIPLLLSSAIIISGIYVFFTFGLPFIGGLLPAAVGVFGFLAYWTGMIFGGLISFVLMMVMMLIVVNLIAIPFHSVLAEKALAEIGHFSNDRIGALEWGKRTWRMLVVSLVKSSLFLVLSIVLFLTGLIPIVQFVSGFLGLVILAFDCTDYSLEILGYGMRQRMSLLKQYFWEFSGFGCAIGISFLIPGLNFLLLPVAVVAGSLLCQALELESRWK